MSRKQIYSEAKHQKQQYDKSLKLKKSKTSLASLAYSIIRIFTLPFKLISKIKDIFTMNNIEEGESSKLFNRRSYERPLQSLNLQQKDLGFTNQVLYQEKNKTINYYVPVYITNKIKSIQKISVQDLTGDISCAMIVTVFYEGLPEEVVKVLENSIIIQLNKGEPVKLEEDGKMTSMKKQEKSKTIEFVIRKVFTTLLHEDSLWSPFELIQMVLSLTINSVPIRPNSVKKISQDSDFCPQKQHKISFNCMRNIDSIPISYALDCVFGVYELAQKKLQVYHSRYGTMGQIKKSYEDSINTKNKNKEKKAQGKKNEQCGLQKPVQRSNAKLQPMTIVKVKKQAPPKLDYFQYTHFIIPLYKYPGNSLATIFIPIFLLALVSLAIFFQEPQLSSRIGAIATMILGYIALIPSIKEQLPPSSKLTVIQSVVYIQTMCCLLCLYESFSIEDEEYTFVWYENYSFLLCLFTHISTFVFIVGIYLVHKLKWQPSYNLDEKIKEHKPAARLPLWANPYCDEIFLKFNKTVEKGSFSKEQKEQLILRPLKEKKESKKQESKQSLQFVLESERIISSTGLISKQE